MLPEGRWAHVRAIRQIIPLQRLREMLLEPGDHLRNLLAWGPGDDEVPEVRAVRTGQQADGDFLLYQRRQPRNEGWLKNRGKLRNLRSLGVAQPGSTPALGEDDPSPAALSRSTIS
jgi:hypothetical protein